MIIEDEQDLLNLYKDYLINKGYLISVSNTTASNVLGDYEEFKPDLVILDYKLPDGKNGLEAANEILEKYPFASILIISAYDSVKQAFNNEKKFVAKNIKLLIKPFKLSKLNELAIDLVNKQIHKQTKN
jgi:DNA-binding NtrC family response regulator